MVVKVTELPVPRKPKFPSTGGVARSARVVNETTDNSPPLEGWREAPRWSSKRMQSPGKPPRQPRGGCHPSKGGESAAPPRWTNTTAARRQWLRCPLGIAARVALGGTKVTFHSPSTLRRGHFSSEGGTQPPRISRGLAIGPPRDLQMDQLPDLAHLSTADDTQTGARHQPCTQGDVSAGVANQRWAHRVRQG